jgi:hypothetical protein
MEDEIINRTCTWYQNMNKLIKFRERLTLQFCLAKYPFSTLFSSILILLLYLLGIQGAEYRAVKNKLAHVYGHPIFNKLIKTHGHK